MPLKIMLTSLSTTPRETTYYLEHNPTMLANAEQSPLALLGLLPREKQPRRIVVLCTDKIKDTTYPNLEESVARDYPGIEVLPIDIPDGTSTLQLWEIMHAVLGDHNLMPAGCQLTLDLTHGFRSFPFIFFTAALYLKALRQVQIDAAYYGIMEVGSREDPKPIVDLSLILEMVEWFYATRIFLETGQAGSLLGRLASYSDMPNELNSQKRDSYRQVEILYNGFKRVAETYAQALPIELGMASGRLLKKLNDPLPSHLRVEMPLPVELFGVIKEFIASFALTGIGWDKRRLKLDYGELRRQTRIIDSYMDQGYINSAMGLIREWMVSVSLFHALYPDGAQVNGERWLSNKERGRKEIEDKLGYLGYLCEKKRGQFEQLNSPQQWLAAQWSFMRKIRNDLHHHGYGPDNIKLDQKKLDEIKSHWEEIKNNLENGEMWQLAGSFASSGGTLLISPLGLSRGLLYSALHHIKPDALFVLSSPDAAVNMDEIKQKAGWEGSVQPQFMQDAFTGFNEAEKICAAALPIIRQFEEVVINVTGGTTAMQHIVQHIFETAQRENPKVRRVALVDRRDYGLQREQPYCVGELINLENK